MGISDMDGFPHILLVSQLNKNLESYKNILKQYQFQISSAANNTELMYCLQAIGSYDIAIIDLTNHFPLNVDFVERISLRMVGGPILVTVRQGDINTVVNAIRRGAYDYILEPFKTEDFIDGIKSTLKKDWRPPLMRARQHIWSRENDLGDIFGYSKIMRQQLHQAGMLARSDTPVLISGSNGVGKTRIISGM